MPSYMKGGTPGDSFIISMQILFCLRSCGTHASKIEQTSRSCTLDTVESTTCTSNLIFSISGVVRHQLLAYDSNEALVLYSREFEGEKLDEI
jgi:hypothetical protein